MSTGQTRENFRTLQSVCSILRVVAGIVALFGVISIPLSGLVGNGVGVMNAFLIVAGAGLMFVQVEIARVLIAIERNTRRARAVRTSHEE